MGIGIIVHRIRKEERDQRIMGEYENKDRLIPHLTYKKLKAEKKCRHCQKKFDKLFIHHVIPKQHGGTNDEKNLTVLCKKCHDKEHDRLGVLTW